MMNKKILVSDALLIDYDILKFEFEATGGKEDEAGPRSDIEVKVGKTKLLDSSPDADHVLYSLTVRVVSAPANNEPFYKCEILVGGTFAIENDMAQDGNVVEEALLVRGAEELYGIARVKVADATATSLYGSYVLPSIRIVPDKQ